MKKLLLKTGTYVNGQGETKNNYVELGAIIQGNDGSEYAIIEPTVDLAGVLIKQNAMAAKEGKQQRDSIMCGIFEKQNQNQSQGGFQQQPQQPHQNQTGGFMPQGNQPPF